MPSPKPSCCIWIDDVKIKLRKVAAMIIPATEIFDIVWSTASIIASSLLPVFL